MSEPFTVDVPVRFRDLDPLNHVNHAVYASYLETARVDYLADVVGMSGDDLSFVVANLEIGYERPIVAGDDPTVALWVSSLGDSSCTMEYEIRVDGDVVATAETTMVHIDSETKQPSTIPTEVREPVLEYEDIAEQPSTQS